MYKIILLLMLTTSLGFSTEISLKTIITPGDKYLYTTTTEQTINQILQGTKLQQIQTSSTKYEMVGVSFDDKKNCLVKCTYKAVALEIKSPYASVSYDSEKAGSTNHIPKEAKPIASLLNKSFTFTISPDSKIVEVKGMDELVDTMLKATGANFNATIKKQMAAKFKQSFGNEAMKRNLQQSISFYPGKNINVKDSWKDQTVMRSIYSLTIDNTWTLNSVESQLATLSLKSTIKASSTAFEINSIKMIPNISGAQEGTFKFNLENHFISESITKQSISGSIKMGRNSIPISTSSKITIKAEKL